MPFNWFRRQFTPATPTPEEPPITEAAPTDEADAASTSEATTSAAETTPTDYLAWAKAAFQNIQQQQKSDSPSESVITEEAATTTDIVDTPTASDSLTESVTEAQPGTLAEEQPETPAPEQPPEPLAQEASMPVEPEPEPVMQVEAELEIPTQDAEFVPESVEPLPLWAKAEAERKARLERLQATAVDTEPVTTSPITIPSTATSSTPDIPAPDAPEAEPVLTFDEGFLWSAEVLAAQGRRPEEISADEITWLQKLRQGLGKTRRGFVNQIKSIVGQGPLNADAVMEIESLLLQADVGIEATDTIVEALQDKMRQETLPPDAAIAYLKTILRNILDTPLQHQYSATFAPEKGTLNIWLMTGVNGAGKTTTIGKIAHVAHESGFTCLVAAADTFRAAAVEQVKVWAKRSNVEVIANPGQNTDPAAVVFDAITAAQSRHTELLLVDTAGRLQNKKNLMDELRKVRQVISKKAPQAKIESLLVLDATLGQNGLRQAQVFAEAANLSGVILTKLDGTAKGGVALAVVQQLGLPIRFIGAGEGIKDLRPFSSHEFVEALLSN
jgi:fused signal recognition particle receptor